MAKPIKDILTIECPYCGKFARKISGRILYPYRRDLRQLEFYRCDPCDAHVGTHKNSGKPLGKLANAELRRAKMLAHKAFDPIWQEGKLSRPAAYGWLANKMHITRYKCHIGMFNLEQCEQVLSVVAIHGKELDM